MHWGREMADYNRRPSSSIDTLLPATIKPNTEPRAFGSPKALTATDLNTIVHCIYINTASAAGKVRTSYGRAA